jgi:hypothetical protein
MSVFSEQGEGRGVGNELGSGKTETMYVANFDTMRKTTFVMHSGEKQYSIWH